MLAKGFEIHVRGEVPPDLLDELEHLTAVEVPAETVLKGVLPDQSALFGVLARLQDLGLELIEVRRLGSDWVFCPDRRPRTHWPGRTVSPGRPRCQGQAASQRDRWGGWASGTLGGPRGLQPTRHRDRADQQWSEIRGPYRAFTNAA